MNGTQIDNPGFDKVLAHINATESEITSRLWEMRARIPEVHEGPEYFRRLQEWRRHARTQRKVFENTLYTIGRRITALAARGWVQDNNIIYLWIRLADTWAHFGGHPRTGIGALFVNAKNELVSYGVNDFPENIDLAEDMATQGKRRDFLICAERDAIARKLGIAFTPPSEEDNTIEGNRKQVQQMHQDILREAKESTVFKDTVMITTAHSCHLCAETAIASGARGVIAKDVDTGHISRQESLSEGARMLEEHGVTVGNFGPEKRTMRWSLGLPVFG
ncbi:MAG: hypothetical protein GC131_02175 [Alphaproteobacteria bacterium]|nr:hypothetical protein [Alphaproteobacteria bacterium]